MLRSHTARFSKLLSNLHRSQTEMESQRIVIKPLQGKSDWPVWRRRIRDALDFHEDTLDVIDGKLQKPNDLPGDSSDAQQKEHKKNQNKFRKANSLAKSIMTGAMSEEVYIKVMDKETAFELWNELKVLFEASAKDQLFSLMSSIFEFQWISDVDVATHAAKLRSIWNDLNVGLTEKNLEKLPELMIVCKMLSILPSSFDIFKSSWQMFKDDQKETLDDLVSQLIIFERGFTPSSAGKSEALLAAKSNHKKKDIKTKPSNSNASSDQGCKYCGKQGHWLRKCEQWIKDGRPTKAESEAKKKGTSSNVANTSSEAKKVALLTICCNNSEVTKSDSSWWIDNGATRHITNCRDHFVDFRELPKSYTVKAAGSEYLQAVGCGTLQIWSIVHKEKKVLDLKEVWFVPEISRNLFSPLAAHDRNPDSTFESSATECVFKVNDEEMVTGSRKNEGNLYKANFVVIPREESVNVTTDMLQLYHERWGHQDKKHVKQKLECDMNVKVKLDGKMCEDCIYGKSCRLPFGTNRRVSKPGELISTDLIGPFHESFSGYTYVVIFKDAYTKYRYSFLLKKKK